VPLKANFAWQGGPKAYHLLSFFIFLPKFMRQLSASINKTDTVARIIWDIPKQSTTAADRLQTCSSCQMLMPTKAQPGNIVLRLSLPMIIRLLSAPNAHQFTTLNSATTRQLDIAGQASPRPAFLANH
jgi:hypothetical protein